MVKKSSSVWTSLLLGAAGGAAAAAFLASKTGKTVKEKVVNFANDYKENHEEINADFVTKAQDLGKQATERFTEVKTQLETGELTVEDLVKSGKEKSLETFEQIKEKIAEQNLSTADILEAIKAKAAKAPTVDLTEEDIEDAVVVSEDIEDAVVVSEDIEIDIEDVQTEVVSETVSEVASETASEAVEG
ncbi:TPA: YtxH domain-containing protein [Streptococcus suis]|nr:YtxH domain-containing protein [Streptococcus suis]HEL1919829.1 YtxH domain-containing protein [Streptococcus suis]HEL2345396.1 YtxH domain-containing protein [Streptococcus suis]HEL2712230.1 YtxH domain-containing protein [Streptococcus suis]HEM4028680.1 YtxH domain-containing protein [Streptococcus suis]